MISWVTGARGFIGRHLALHLHAGGDQVCGIGHGHLPAEAWSQAGLSQWLNSDLSPEALNQLVAMGNGAPDRVFHLAGGSSVGASLQSPLEDFRRTTSTTATMLEWLRTCAPHAKFVSASSAAVYGDTGAAMAKESAIPAPVSPYGYHKLMMELLCHEYSQVFGLQTVIVRLFSVYGEGLRKQLLWDCAGKLMSAGNHIELGGTGEELRDWVHVDDAVRILESAARIANAASPVINGGSGRGIAVRELVGQLSQALGQSKRIEFSGVSRPGDPLQLVADPSRLQGLGQRCTVGLADGVRRYADWFSLERDR